MQIKENSLFGSSGKTIFNFLGGRSQKGNFFTRINHDSFVDKFTNDLTKDLETSIKQGKIKVQARYRSPEQAELRIEKISNRMRENITYIRSLTYNEEFYRAAYDFIYGVYSHRDDEDVLHAWEKNKKVFIDEINIELFPNQLDEILKIESKIPESTKAHKISDYVFWWWSKSVEEVKLDLIKYPNHEKTIETQIYKIEKFWTEGKKKEAIYCIKQLASIFYELLLKTKNEYLSEGGSMPGVGVIHISEINPTLKHLESILQIDLINNTLGSVGKKEFSGDMDVVIDNSKFDIKEFTDKLRTIPEIISISAGSPILTKIKIINYDPTKIPPDGRKRTGYVQLDFMFGEPNWTKVRYHAPYEKDSKYPGVYRNILISTIAASVGRKESLEKIDDGRPLKLERYKFTNNDGLIRVLRTPALDSSNTKYTKKDVDVMIGGPYKTLESMAQVLGLDGPDDFYSFETLKAAIGKNYNSELVHEILNSFSKNEIVQKKGIPKEIINETEMTWLKNKLERLLT